MPLRLHHLIAALIAGILIMVTACGGSDTGDEGEGAVASATLTPAPAPDTTAPPDATAPPEAAALPEATAPPEAAALPEATEPPEASPAKEREWDLQGHRGARGLRPENTLPGFELALDLLVDTLEFDLHLSADDVVVVWHDPIIDSQKCVVDDDVAVRDLTIVEITEIRCDRNPDTSRFPDQVADQGEVAGDDYTIAALTDVFTFVGDYANSELKSTEQRANAETVRFNIETKRKPADPGAIGDGFDGSTMGTFEDAIITAAQSAGMLDRVTVQSFDHRSLWAINGEHPDVSLAALSFRNDVPDPVELVANGADIWSPDFRTLDQSIIEAAHAAGLLVIPWTVNEPDDMDALLALGVDGLITDRPDLVPR